MTLLRDLDEVTVLSLQLGFVLSNCTSRLRARRMNDAKRASHGCGQYYWRSTSLDLSSNLRSDLK